MLPRASRHNMFDIVIYTFARSFLGCGQFSVQEENSTAKLLPDAELYCFVWSHHKKLDLDGVMTPK